MDLRNISSPIRISNSPIKIQKAPLSAQKPPRPSSQHKKANWKSLDIDQIRIKSISFMELDKQKTKWEDNQEVANPVTSVSANSSKFQSFNSRRNSFDSHASQDRSSNLSSSVNSLNYSPNDNVKVCVRVRPFNDREKQTVIQNGLEIDQESNIINISASGSAQGSGALFKKYKFDFVADEEIGQQQFFETAAQPIVDSCLNGMNGSIFAYGQTGAGKTYTIQGNSHKTQSDSINSSDDRGILQRSFEYMFTEIQKRKSFQK